MSDDDRMPEKLRDRLGSSDGRHLFVPSHFDFSDSRGILDFIHHTPLAQIVCLHRGEIRITATPLLHEAALDDGGHCFIGHLARRNPQSRAIREGADGTAVIQGPDAYISPRWNVENPGLPTWSYVDVQLRGRFEPLEDEADRRWVLDRTIAHMERHADTPWHLDDAPPELVATLLGHIVAFRFRVHDMQGVQRLNQNRKPVDKQGIVAGLLSCGDPGSTRIAALMAAAMTEQPERRD